MTSHILTTGMKAKNGEQSIFQAEPGVFLLDSGYAETARERTPEGWVCHTNREV